MEKDRSYERLFAILIALTAATSGLAGFLSAEAGREAVGAANTSLKWQQEATFSYDSNMAMIQHDQQLLTDANVQETLGDINHDMTYYSIAEELRSQTYIYSMGYIDLDGTGTLAYNDNFTQAFVAYATNMLADYNQFRKNSDEFSALAKSKAGDANSYLLATVILAFGVVIAATGLSLSRRSNRQVMLVVVACIIVASLIYIVTI